MRFLKGEEKLRHASSIFGKDSGHSHAPSCKRTMARNIVLSLRRTPQTEIATMARSKPSKQLSQAEIDRFLTAAEALHKSIIKPFISPHCEHYRATRSLHEALLKSVREVTGKEVEFIQWNTTGPVRPKAEWTLYD
ncbi:hypothetical protein X739_31170 [Mesorhizobium sp. LNHC220B00]|nr:hypothetical protein X739_31170 [Mesorhizobium sp. LNHC220B00]